MFFALAVAAAFKYTDIGYYFSREFIEKTLDRLGVWAPAGFVLIYAVGTTLGVPGTIMTILGGVLFGSLLGTVLVVIGATTGACCAFLVARFLARDFIAERFGSAPWFKRLDRGIKEEGIYFILFVRLVPIFPFNGLNFATGLTNVRFRDYLLGTFLGIIPASFIFVNAAAQAAEAAAGERVGPGLFVSLALLGMLALVPVAYKRYKGAGDHREGGGPDSESFSDRKGK
ncbi:MAG: TVP38/TMEM64 family protein [Candidatus Nitrospinota bacterium M3_3B_026]